MTRRFVFRVACWSFLALLAGVLASDPAQAATKRLKARAHDGTVKVQVAGKSSLYYRASRANPAEFTVSGSLPLRVLARSLVLEPGAPLRHLVIEVDGRAVRTISLKGRTAKDAVIAGNGKPGLLAKASLHLGGSGRHKIRIYPREENHVAAVRVLSGSSSKQALKWVAFAPETYEKAARLQLKDSEVTCYRFSASKPAGMDLHGPIRLKVTSRLDFGISNGYTQSYLVKVLLDGKPWKSFSLKSRASHTASYPDMGELVPGIPQEFQVEVPAGSHQLLFMLDGTTASGAALQIRVPTRDLEPQGRSKPRPSLNTGS